MVTSGETKYKLGSSHLQEALMQQFGTDATSILTKASQRSSAIVGNNSSGGGQSGINNPLTRRQDVKTQLGNEGMLLGQASVEPYLSSVLVASSIRNTSSGLCLSQGVQFCIKSFYNMHH